MRRRKEELGLPVEEIWARRLAQRLLSASNDAVKLAWLGEEEARELVDKLDLSLLAEFKRSANGAVEIKLVDRVKALSELAKLLRREESAPQRSPQAEALYRALEAGAQSAQEHGHD